MFVIPTGGTPLFVIPTGAKRGGGIPLRNLFVRRRDSSVRAGLVVSVGMTDTLKRFCWILLRKFCGVGIRITRFQKYSGISSPYHLGHARNRPGLRPCESDSGGNNFCPARHHENKPSTRRHVS